MTSLLGLVYYEHAKVYVVGDFNGSLDIIRVERNREAHDGVKLHHRFL